MTTYNFTLIFGTKILYEYYRYVNKKIIKKRYTVYEFHGLRPALFDCKSNNSILYKKIYCKLK